MHVRLRAVDARLLLNDMEPKSLDDMSQDEIIAEGEAQGVTLT